MFTHQEAKRWASVMTAAALRGDMPPDEIARQVGLLRERYGDESLERALAAVLNEAGRIGPGHSSGDFYRQLSGQERLS